MTGALARSDPALDRLLQRFLGRLPSRFAGFQLEQALDHPGSIRTQSRGALGQAQRRCSVTGAQCLVEEAAKSEKFRLGAVEHRRKEPFGRRLVAPELSRLGRQEEGQWRVREQRIGPASATLRLLRITRCNRNHAPSQRTVAGTTPTLAAAPQKCARAVEGQRHEPKKQRNRQAGEHRGGGQHADRGLYLPAPPDNLDLPGMIGKKNRRRDHPGEDEEA